MAVVEIFLVICIKLNLKAIDGIAVRAAPCILRDIAIAELKSAENLP